MPAKIYVDGQEGTTGLRINELLAARTDIEILKIDSDKRKDTAERKRLLNAADIVFLCLPDAASREAVALVDNPQTKIIDASTAFRTDPTWVYGLPELSPTHRQKIKNASRVAVPGCHASAFILALYPLVQAGIVPPDMPITAFSLTGYSGGGKKMIAQYEAGRGVTGVHASACQIPPHLHAPRHYALKLTHKHLPEMQTITGLTHPPLFTPVVAPIHSGLCVETFLPTRLLKNSTTPQSIQHLLATHYANEPFIHVFPYDATATTAAGALNEGFLDITACNGTNRTDLIITGNPAQIALLARLDNLGKGASGAAIQCLNLMLALDESTGLQS
ncbi:MAG: N-acetyl-gamma-glutamyl-phosphate reductase [Phycisphaerales bacterium]|nr:N-acetyl-gamma-glutamyl-phosphate reductase [Phycisphaerales bacterium]